MYIHKEYYGLADDGKPNYLVECQRDDSEDQPTDDSVEGHIIGGIDWNTTTGKVSAWSTTAGDWIEQFSTKDS